MDGRPTEVRHGCSRALLDIEAISIITYGRVTGNEQTVLAWTLGAGWAWANKDMNITISADRYGKVISLDWLY